MGDGFRFEDIPDDPRDLLRECEVSFYRASGPGGQHRNKTETAVRIVHLPTGITAVAADERSQFRTREAAAARLREKLVRRLKPRKPRRPTSVPTREKAVRLRAKKIVAEKKRLRQGPAED